MWLFHAGKGADQECVLSVGQMVGMSLPEALFWIGGALLILELLFRLLDDL